MINKRYLIALDLDGTLLKDDKTISLKTKTYLKKLEDEGNLIVLCSGRAERSVLAYYKDIGLKISPLIAYNGHLSFNPNNPNHYKILHKINEKTAKNVYSELIYNGIDSAMSECEGKIFIDKNDDFLFAFYEKDGLEVIEGPLDKNIDCDVLTFVMKFTPTDENRNKITSTISSLNTDVRVRFWGGDNYCELYEKGVSKSKTIKDVAKLYNIDLDNIIVFGDADNDIEMLQDYKHTYLMKNGMEHLKQYAKHVTEYTNEEDGIIYELNKFFNK